MKIAKTVSKIMMYSVIELPMENGESPEVEVVPNLWLHEKEGEYYCLWPRTMPITQIRKAIEKAYLPEKDWERYNCRLLHTSESYNEARKKLVNAEFTSTLESETEMSKYQRPKRKLKRPFRFHSDSSECDNDGETICDDIPSPPKLRTPTKSNIVSSRTSTVVTMCKPSTLTVASPKHLSSIEVNYGKSFAINSNSPRRSSSVASNDNQSAARKHNSPMRSSNVGNNCAESSCRNMSSPNLSSASKNYQQSYSRKSISPRSSYIVATNDDQSASKNNNVARRSSNIGNNYKQSSSKTIISPYRPFSASKNYGKPRSKEMHSPRSSCSVASNYEESPVRKSISPISRNIEMRSQRYSSREVNPLQTSSNITSEDNKSDVFYVILTKVVSLEKSMNILLPMMRQLMTHFRLTKVPNVENFSKIPVDSRKDLDNFEKYLAITENFEHMINILSISGGTTIAQMTRKTLEKLITNEYASNYNWAGRAPKMAFKSLKMRNLVVATVRRLESNAAITVIENAIKDWLKLSSVRLTLDEARALKRNMTITNKN